MGRGSDDGMNECSGLIILCMHRVNLGIGLYGSTILSRGIAVRRKQGVNERV
jgi:hypothetical protein